VINLAEGLASAERTVGEGEGVDVGVGLGEVVAVCAQADKRNTDKGRMRVAFILITGR